MLKRVDTPGRFNRLEAQQKLQRKDVKRTLFPSRDMCLGRLGLFQGTDVVLVSPLKAPGLSSGLFTKLNTLHSMSYALQSSPKHFKLKVLKKQTNTVQSSKTQARLFSKQLLLAKTLVDAISVLHSHTFTTTDKVEINKEEQKQKGKHF